MYLELKENKEYFLDKEKELENEKKLMKSKVEELFEWENRLKDYTNEIENKQRQLINKEEQMKDLLQSFDAPIHSKISPNNTDSSTFVYNSIDDDTPFQNRSTR